MKILAIDPGTRCGWALFVNGAPIASGVWNLAPRRHEGGGMRFVRLASSLRALLADAPPSTVFYEEVRRHAGTDAAHIYGGIVATIARECEERGIAYSGIPVGTIKKLATGKGNADKDAMVAAAARRWPSIEIEDDNHADALWCGVAGLHEIGEEAVA